MNRSGLNQPFYLSAVFVTYVGNSMIFIAAGKIAYDHFGLASVFGALLMAEFLKSLLLSGFAGWVVERFPARNVAIAADLGLFTVECLLALFAFAGQEKWAVVLVTLIVNFAKPFQNAATFSFVRQIFPKDQLFKLNSRSAAALNSGYLVGLTVAGLLISRVSMGTFLILDAMTYLVSALLFFACRPMVSWSPTNVGKKPMRGLVSKYLDLAREHPQVVRFAVLIGIQMNLTIAYNTLLFKNVAERYENRSDILSLLEGVFTISYLGVSTLLSSSDRFRLPARRLWIPFGLQGICFASFTAPLPVTALAATVTFFGALSPIIFSSTVTSLHDHTPDSIQGWVGGLKGSVQALIALPLLAINSALADGIGLAHAFAYLACIHVVACGLVVRSNPFREVMV